MKTRLAILFGLSFCILYSSCDKDGFEAKYTGVVVEELTGCSSSKGKPYVLSIQTENDRYKTVSTVTLPDRFKVTNAKISFKIRELADGDDYMFCNASIVAPLQVVVYEVSPNG